MVKAPKYVVHTTDHGVFKPPEYRVNTEDHGVFSPQAQKKLAQLGQDHLAAMDISGTIALTMLPQNEPTAFAVHVKATGCTARTFSFRLLDGKWRLA